MKMFYRLLICVFLASCNNEKIEMVDLSEYFMGIRGTTVFYDPINEKYKIHNISLSEKRSG